MKHIAAIGKTLAVLSAGSLLAAYVAYQGGWVHAGLPGSRQNASVESRVGTASDSAAPLARRSKGKPAATAPSEDGPSSQPAEDKERVFPGSKSAGVFKP